MQNITMTKRELKQELANMTPVERIEFAKLNANSESGRIVAKLVEQIAQAESKLAADVAKQQAQIAANERELATLESRRVDAELEQKNARESEHRSELKKAREKAVKSLTSLDQTIVKRQLEYLDGVAKTDVRKAVMLAEQNTRATGNWGSIWLEENAAQIGKIDSATEAPASVVKHAHDTAEAARAAYDGYIVKYADANQLDYYKAKGALIMKGDATLTDLATKLAAAMMPQTSEHVLKALAAGGSDLIKAQMDKMVEDFALAQGISIIDARKRLEGEGYNAISPTYLKLKAEWTTTAGSEFDQAQADAAPNGYEATTLTAAAANSEQAQLAAAAAAARAANRSVYVPLTEFGQHMSNPRTGR